MIEILTNIWLSLRPQQWIKNLAVLAPAFFAGVIFDSASWLSLIWSFVLLSAASSGSYLINDLLDKEKDQLHPLKANRPIASGKLSENVAVLTAIFLLTFAIVAAFQFRTYFALTVCAFVALQLLYSLILKRIILIDVMTIAATFSLRVFAGAFVLSVPISSWLVITTIMLALLLAIGKRRAEVTLLTHRLAAKHREVVGQYPRMLLDGMTFMMATATIITYALFSFNAPEVTTRHRITELLPQTLNNPKWIMITIPFVIYGIFRYLFVIYEKKEGSSPERVLITDIPLLLAVLGWAGAAWIAVYVAVR